MGAGIIVALLIIGFSTATFLVGLGIGHILGEAKAVKKQHERVTQAIGGYARAVMLTSAQGGSTEDVETVGDHGEMVN